MEMQSTRSIAAPVGSVWAALNDPGILKECIPGCETIEPDGENAYRISLAARIGPVADSLRPGDRVWFRHATAGELCEHVNELQLVDGDTATPAPTYRGEGHAFLG